MSDKQDKQAEIQASGTVLSRFDYKVWSEHLVFKENNIHAASLDSISGHLILDFGCGPGTYGIILGRRNYVVGVDIAKQAVEQARDRAKQFRSDMDSILNDGENLCLRAKSLDVCFSGWAIHHLPSVKKTIQSFYELLKPNGMVVIIEPNENSLGMRIARIVEDRMRGLILKSGLDTPNRCTHTNQEYEDALKVSGFEILNVFTHYNGEMSEVPNDIHGIKRTLVKALIYARHVLLWVSTHLIRQGAEVFFIAKKPS